MAALAAGVLMLLTEVTTVISIDVAAGSCDSIYDTSPDLADDCSQKGFERHSVALLLLGLLTFAMGSGAAFGRSRPAAVALIAIGVVVLGLTLLRDLPASDDTGLIGRDYAAGRGHGGHRAVARAGGRGAGGSSGPAAGYTSRGLMLRLRSCISIALAALCPGTVAAQEPCAAPATRRSPSGIGEQSPELFEDARFRATGIRHARLIVPYDVVKAGGWPLARGRPLARRARAATGSSRSSRSRTRMAKRRQFRLPSVREYAARVAEFRARYPWVREFSTWNEANHQRRAAHRQAPAPHGRLLPGTEEAVPGLHRGRRRGSPDSLVADPGAGSGASASARGAGRTSSGSTTTRT